MKYFKVLPILAVITVLLASVHYVAASNAANLRIEPVVEKLKTPWSFGFLPDGGLLITERGGKLLHVSANGRRNTVSGLPRIQSDGQGGLLDVLIPRDFSSKREIFLTFVQKQSGGTGTAVARGKLSADGSRLADVKTIFQMSQGSKGSRHYGSRLAEAKDGTLFFTIGDRGDRPSAQNLAVHNGAVLRITRNGKPAKSNPFVNQSDAQPEIWSYGHRNPQGLAFDLNGQLWSVEHGAKGGDELNKIGKGNNYGWPVIAFGRHYSGQKIGEGTSKAGMKQPVVYWDPSIAPSGLAIYSGKLWPEWKGAFFVGSLKFDYISILSGNRLRETGKIGTPETRRVRDVREGPLGGIWFLSEDRGTLYRITPNN
ncbi:glucose/arabinose dehydrogenase [Shimia isoporae]|uniref:Glucose/arabinose dehydrogenase n=1 Tax=Shimia isoporae TaxID=647720 RepID=A0A4R1NRR0_9RHOB|nr:PQQ-dependent sugar dehydrogenase [Shimia isoporae]TCL09433.1 glucose/arabinose dehydrogenase [Shimia isoporae]